MSLEGADRRRYLDAIYPTLSRHDFSRDLLEVAPVSRSSSGRPTMGWSDLGTPERLMAWSAADGRRLGLPRRRRDERDAHAALDVRAHVAAYYRNPSVRARLHEYCGDEDDCGPSATFVAGFDPTEQPYPTWSNAAVVPPSELDALAARGCDLLVPCGTRAR